jgi:predicted flap endonuclease-1-like 5' DNA nuclease
LAVEEEFMSYPVADIEGIGPDEAAVLKRVGIRTTDKLLEAAKSLKGRKHLAAKTGIDEKRLLKWANSADRMRIKGVGDDYAELIRAAGVDTVRELGFRNAKRLTQAMAKANEKRRLVQFLPSEKAVRRWIDQAKKLTPKITY